MVLGLRFQFNVLPFPHPFFSFASRLHNAWTQPAPEVCPELRCVRAVLEPAHSFNFCLVFFQVWGSFSLVSYLILGVAGIFNDLALYLVVLTAFLQRGPVPPHSDEISEPDTTRKALGIAALAFGLLVLLPFPIPFSDNGQQLLDSGNSLML